MNDENRPINASLSTMWAFNNFPDLNVFFEVAKQLGFEKIELNHQINSTMLAQVNLDHLQFSSIHDPCPADLSTKKLAELDWLISSTDEICRKHGVEVVKRSINLAHELGAPTVVIHCGTVLHNAKAEDQLRSLFMAGKGLTDEYLQIKSRFTRLRQGLVEPRLEAVKQSLDELIDFAANIGIKLGLENRYHFMDIPSIDEMAELLSLASSDQLGFIYDVGHAYALDRLGFYAHKEWLLRFSDRLFGTHLHDIVEIRDHYAPGLGEVDFSFIAGYLPENAFRTLEIQPGNTLAQVEDGINLLVETGCIRYL